jgi:hypothetical protein
MPRFSRTGSVLSNGCEEGPREEIQKRCGDEVTLHRHGDGRVSCPKESLLHVLFRNSCHTGRKVGRRKCGHPFSALADPSFLR